MGKNDLEKGFGFVDIDRLVPADWNYKEMDTHEAEELLESLENNFKRNGQIENILIRKLHTGFYEVVNGNHRLVVAKRLKLDKLMCFNFGEISEAAAKRIALETNETKFKADQVKLAKLLVELKLEYDHDELLSTLPYDEDEVANFEKLLNFNWEENGGGGGGSESRGLSDFETIRFDLPKEIAEQFNAQVDRFKKILYPDERVSEVSYVLPIEAMIQSLAQIPDQNIIGE